MTIKIKMSGMSPADVNILADVHRRAFHKQLVKAALNQNTKGTSAELLMAWIRGKSSNIVHSYTNDHFKDCMTFLARRVLLSPPPTALKLSDSPNAALELMYLCEERCSYSTYPNIGWARKVKVKEYLK